MPARVTGLLGLAAQAAGGATKSARPARSEAPQRHGFASVLAGLGASVLDVPGIAHAAPPAATAPVAVAEPGLDPEAGNREGRRRIAAMLEALEGLQRGLLAGQVDRACLERLAGLAAAETVGDPRLAELAADIALRARVELARLGAAADRCSGRRFTQG
jgi:hypothetical protein